MCYVRSLTAFQRLLLFAVNVDFVSLACSQCEKCTHVCILEVQYILYANCNAVLIAIYRQVIVVTIVCLQFVLLIHQIFSYRKTWNDHAKNEMVS